MHLQNLSHTHRLKVVGHGHREEGAVGPLRHDAGGPFHLFWVKAGAGRDVFEHITNQGGVAVNVGPDLQHRGFAIAARQGCQFGFGHDHGNEHALPIELFVTQDQANFFGKRRIGVVVQDEV